MKKATMFAAAALCAVVAMTGCQSINTSDSGNMTINPETTEPLTSYRPIYELTNKAPVTGNAKIHCLFGLFVWGGAGSADYADMTSQDDSFFTKLIPNAKAKGAKSAFYDACVANQCDALVASRYTIKTTDYFVYAQYDITVKGYPVKQVGVEAVKPVPYYVDGEGKIVILDKFVKMYNVMPTPPCKPAPAKSGCSFLPF